MQRENLRRTKVLKLGFCNMRVVRPSLSQVKKSANPNTDVLQVAHHYFENAIAFFTRRINKCISMMCANGEVAPFVGHNAFLRWSALQDAAFGGGDINSSSSSTPSSSGPTPNSGSGPRAQVKIWSEDNVSEDFDMALRLLRQGYIVRFVSTWFFELGC